MCMRKTVLVDLNDLQNISQIEETKNKISAAGENVGNIVWYQTVKRRLVYDKEIGILSTYSETGDTYVIPMANNINMRSWQFVKISDNWAKGSNQIIILGLGAQLTQELNTPKKLVNALPKEIKRAIQSISLYTNDFEVRGNMTAECLELLGVHNYKVLGCPSFYYSPTNMLNICDLELSEISNLALSFDHYGNEKTRNFFEMCFYSQYWKKAKWVMQTMRDMPLTMEGLKVEERHLQNRFPGTSVEAEMFFNNVRQKGVIFFDFDEWGAFFKKENIDLSVGMRFHGNMIALLNGIPALWITHDDRTEELCDVIGLPHVDIKKITVATCLDEIIERVNYDINYRNKYISCLKEYMVFLNNNHITYRWDEIEERQISGI